MGSEIGAMLPWGGSGPNFILVSRFTDMSVLLTLMAPQGAAAPSGDALHKECPQKVVSALTQSEE